MHDLNAADAIGAIAPAHDETALMVAADLAATLGRAIELYGDNPDDAHRDLVLKLLPVLAERLPDAGLAELDVYGEGQLALVMQYE